MFSEYNVLDHPADHAKNLILSAFNVQAKNRRNLLRVIQRALSLAEQRGYLYAAEFIQYFRTATVHNPRVVNRLLSSFFEYVSPDEFSQLMKLY